MNKAIEKIKVIAMDVDGVLTDGSIFLDSQGREIKRFHSQDGLALVLARNAGLKTSMITARKSKAVAERARELKVDALYQNRTDKVEALEDLMRRFKVLSREVCYVGDDLADLAILKRVGFPVAVANAVKDVKRAAIYVTSVRGGEGAIRELVEYILKAQGRWRDVTREYFNAS